MIQAFNKKARSEGGKIWEEVPMYVLFQAYLTHGFLYLIILLLHRLFIKFAGTEGQIKSDMDRVGRNRNSGSRTLPTSSTHDEPFVRFNT